MKTTQMDYVVSLAERVAGLRRDLATAEEELQRAVSGKVAMAKSRPGRPSASSMPVAQRVRNVLARRKLTFGQVKEAVLQPGESHFAVRSAISKDRERGVIGYDEKEKLYYLVGNGAEKEKAPPPVKEEGPSQPQGDGVLTSAAPVQQASAGPIRRRRQPQQPSRR